MVITELPSDQAKKALEALCMPAVIPLQVGIRIGKIIEKWKYFYLMLMMFKFFVENQEIINQGPEVLGQKPSREVTVHIDRLANIFRHVLQQLCSCTAFLLLFYVP